MTFFGFVHSTTCQDESDGMRPRMVLFAKLSNIVPRRSMHVGETVVGRKARYRLIEALQDINNTPTVFRAKVLQDGRNLIPCPQ